MKYKVRFHLGAGEHYRQWQVRAGKETKYYDPDQVCILMKGCKLKNRPHVAKLIYQGANKSVCAWIECDDLWIKEHSPIVGEASQIAYNPRNAPYWVEDGQNVDGKLYAFLHTHQRGIFRCRH